MAYHGFIPLCKNYLHSLKHSPSMLEVGVDRGVTYLSLVTFLARTRPEFLAIGVDVLVQEQVNIMLANLDLQSKQDAWLVGGNSLKVLPSMVEQSMKFDLVLLDGDHNYHTVSNELKSLEHLVKEDSIIIIDDYHGRWSERDLWYADREGYEKNENVSKPVDTTKHGVKPAVDEWLEAHPEWKKTQPVQGEPVLLSRQPI